METQVGLFKDRDTVTSAHLSPLLFFFFFFLIYFWLCWVFVSVRGLSLVVASGGHSSSRCVGLSLSWPLLLWSTGSRRTGSVVVAHGPSCSAACGIFPAQGLNPCPLHWQADSQPLRHQGSPLPTSIDLPKASPWPGPSQRMGQHTSPLMRGIAKSYGKGRDGESGPVTQSTREPLKVLSR